MKPRFGGMPRNRALSCRRAPRSLSSRRRARSSAFPFARCLSKASNEASRQCETAWTVDVDPHGLTLGVSSDAFLETTCFGEARSMPLKDLREHVQGQGD